MKEIVFKLEERAIMITVRQSHARGQTQFSGLDSKHTFSFGTYFDPNYTGFGKLRVINDDIVAPGKGFGTHSHRNMEIISYVLQGALEHRDSMGNGSVIQPGDVQRMSAGTGIAHSEFNASRTEPVHFLQIWIMPEQAGLEPSYEQKSFPVAEKQGKLKLVASPDGQDNSVIIHQDANLYVAILHEGDRVTHKVDNTRNLWLQMTRGSVTVKGQTLEAGDGAAITQELELTIIGTTKDTEFLLFDLA